MVSKKHAPNRLEYYFNIHDTIMDQFCEVGHINTDKLDDNWDNYPLVVLSGGDGRQLDLVLLGDN